MRRYPLEQSPLYKITSPRRLAEVLGLDEAELEELANRLDNYKRFKVGKTKKRDVQEPKDRLRAIHKRISRWLARIETPDYLHSAIKGRSYITNAKAHRADTNLIKVDIRSFFQNVTKHAVYLFFLDTMQPTSGGQIGNSIEHALMCIVGQDGASRASCGQMAIDGQRFSQKHGDVTPAPHGVQKEQVNCVFRDVLVE